MANSYIQVPVDGSGKKVDTTQLAVGANTVERERDQIAGTNADDLAEVTDTDPSSTDHGLTVRAVNVRNPIRDTRSSAALAAGSSVDLDGTTIASGKTGKLQAVILASTAGLCRFEIKTRNGAVEVSIGVAITSQLAPTFIWAPPDKRYDTLAGAGVDENFRVTATNLDDSRAADVYATIYWDEV
jgi:hypothetical protein